MSPRFSARIHPLAIVLAAALIAASPGCKEGRSNATNPPGTIVVGLTDAPFSDFTTFQMTLTDLTLQTSAGDVQAFPTTAGDTLPINVTQLNGVNQVIAVVQPPKGGVNVNGATMSFADVQAAAGVDQQTVTPASGTVQVVFATPVLIPSERTVTIVLDLNGAQSITSTGPTTATFAPVLFPTTTTQFVPFQSAFGSVLARSVTGFTMLVDGSQTLNGTPITLGTLGVTVQPTTNFVVNGSPLDSSQGLALLQPGDRVAVSGQTNFQGLLADTVEVQRSTDTNPVTAVGTITSVSAPSFNMILDSVQNDALNQIASTPVGSEVTVVTSGTTSFTGIPAADATTLTGFFPGETVRVIGSFAAPTLTAAMVTPVSSSLTGTLTSLDATNNTGVFSVSGVNGSPVATFPSLSNVDMNFANTTPVFLDGLVQVPFASVAPTQPLLVNGNFSSATGFTPSSLSISGLSDVSGPVERSDPATSRFILNVDGSPVTVQLRPETQLFITREGQANKLIGLTGHDFFTELPHATGEVTVRGLRSDANVQATQASFVAPAK